jgi:RHS repeat-associated protein
LRGDGLTDGFGCQCVTGAQRVRQRHQLRRCQSRGRLIAVTNTVSGQVSRFYYDADGQRVKRVDPSGTTAYVGQHFEVQASAGISTSYYYFGSQRVAMRVVASPNTAGTLYWLRGDSLGSASLTTNITGTVVSEMRYYSFGQARWVTGTMPTDRLFAGMRSETASAVGSLIDMNAREYSPLLGRFLSADSIVPQPGDPQSLNRYAYTRNSPLEYIDPSGHDVRCLYLCPNPSPILFNPQLRDALDIVVHAEDIIHTPANTSRVTDPTSQDLTSWLIDRMKENAASPIAAQMRQQWTHHEKVAALESWVSMVRPDAVWDYKKNLVTLRTRYGDNFTLGGFNLNYQTVANIAYGYTGSAAGFSSEVLQGGAGAFQLYQHGIQQRDWKQVGPSSTYFDQPLDNWSVKFGIYLYGKYGSDTSKLTPDEFAKSLQSYMKENGAPPPAN